MSAKTELVRAPAQFFYEVGYASAYAEATIRNGMVPPFSLTDALIERAWKIAGEAYDDPEEFDRYLAQANASTTLKDEAIDELVDGLRVTLRFIENTEGELGIVLDSGELARALIAKHGKVKP